MSREKEGYREQLEIIKERFPGYDTLSTEQVAEYFHCNKKTVLSNISRRTNPLPAKNIGIGRKIWRIPVAGLARWSLP